MRGKLKIFTILYYLVLFNLCGAQNWKQAKFAEVDQLKELQDNKVLPPISSGKFQKFGIDKKDENHFERTFRKILKVRIPGTDGSRQVRQDIENDMASLGWSVEEDSFEQNTVVGRVRFTNIIATLDPSAPRRMVIACHYDSKMSPQGFLGATDSAVPCAQMINLAKTLQSELDNLRGRKSEVTLQFLFFDGEEAFKTWTATDSLYGSRHLAAKWSRKDYDYQGVSGNELDRIDVFMLLDLLGAANPVVTSSHLGTEPWFKRLMDAEDIVDQNGFSTSRRRIFRTPNRNGLLGLLGGGSGINDDHKPFERKGVPILHIISSPFPSVWHKSSDNAGAINRNIVEKLNMVFRIFVSEYLSLQ